MNDIEITKLDLVEGGNVFKQGHYLTLGYAPRDRSGESVNLEGKDIAVSLYNRYGVSYETTARFDAGNLYFDVKTTIPSGEMFVEFTATDPNDESYRMKFPTNPNAAKLSVVPSTDDLGNTGIVVYTVGMLLNEQKKVQQEYESTVDGKLSTVEQRLEDGIGAFTKDTEILDARMGETNLRVFNQKTIEKLAEKASQLFAENVNARIDNLIVHEGDGNKDSEIIDARLSVLGKTADSLKGRFDDTDSNFLLTNGIEGTKQTVLFNEDGTPQSVNHKNSEGVSLREDTFSYNGDSIMEKRTLFNNKAITFLYNLSTFETTVLSQQFKDELPYDANYQPWQNAEIVNGGLSFVGRRDTYYTKDFKKDAYYGLLLHVDSNTLTQYLRVFNNFTGNYEEIVSVDEGVGAKKIILKTRVSEDITRLILSTISTETGAINISDVRLFELAENSQIKYDFENLTADELHNKYPKEVL